VSEKIGPTHAAIRNVMWGMVAGFAVFDSVGYSIKLVQTVDRNSTPNAPSHSQSHTGNNLENSKSDTALVERINKFLNGYTLSLDHLDEDTPSVKSLSGKNCLHGTVTPKVLLNTGTKNKYSRANFESTGKDGAYGFSVGSERSNINWLQVLRYSDHDCALKYAANSIVEFDKASNDWEISLGYENFVRSDSAEIIYTTGRPSQSPEISLTVTSLDSIESYMTNTLEAARHRDDLGVVNKLP
jgi:hypothetical protein